MRTSYGGPNHRVNVQPPSLLLIVLCLTWTGSPRVLAQRLDSLAPSAENNSIAIGSLHDSLDHPSDGIEIDGDESKWDIFGSEASGDNSAECEAGVAQISAASRPPPFGGPWNSWPKLVGDWWGLREELRDNGLTFDISETTYYQGLPAADWRRPSGSGAAMITC